jgi:16S rRNA (cytosine1402-N4)-methyltransferase
VPEFIHKPVMAAEVLAALKPRRAAATPTGRSVELVTQRALLAASSPTGWLSGCDRDGAAVEAARARLAENLPDGLKSGAEIFRSWPDGFRRKLRRRAFGFGREFAATGFAGRGFSFQQDGPLDMRMDDRQPLTAADLVNGESAERWRRFFGNLAANASRGGLRGRLSMTARSENLRRRGNWRS